MKELLDNFLGILNTISEGGPKAIIAIMFMGMTLVITANYFLVKFMIKFFQKMNESREHLISEKDEMLKERIAKMDALLEAYNKGMADSTDATRKIETAVHDINLLLNSFLYQNNNGNFRRK